jgi:hypothetical protein
MNHAASRSRSRLAGAIGTLLDRAGYSVDAVPELPRRRAGAGVRLRIELH